ncbi:Rne/Rng family ribonuclease [Alterisphingorhabdus coralli]|uniref:Ribonuclease E n=1 Tax=Alterisphingorhabdus coralli TaxID=3071408 RepID=A0AA97F9Y7_9SPHN|nr:Rne/Rng family ribonuclease [Parasphingorhabdus sp. SCSIO 66989]WOE76266.1 Rne/Rng family ribonuclease [Parasphingorhabdus sp. SCSIO 66989]
MTTRMLIDARHQEETRVAVTKGNRIEEFDFESAEHKQIKGNIYLAKVTRVEPSLQAAFVDYGGNRHGFLAFSEIHPDYYQIPKEDKDKLLAEEAEHAAEEAALRAAEEERGETGEDDDGDYSRAFADELAEDHGMLDEKAEEKLSEPEAPELPDDDDDDADGESSDEEAEAKGEDDSEGDKAEGGKKRRRGGRSRRGNRRGKGAARASDEVRSKRMALRRRYKIQDVIHRRQVVLVQVMKEERGNKGAALSTYLSLAGRYCVLMPNSAHGGGISRKISSAGDRKRLKGIIAELNLPSSMGCIVRTAGLSRTKTEIKRDFDYLARLWDGIRENTLKASAPAQIHSDSDLIKRAIRDIYNREIEEVMVEGDDGYRAAKDFMKLLMPSHARRVKHYADPIPLFQRYGAEDQLNAMYEPMVQLKSGGYLVINPTEALVSIDINSGRSTREHGIEATAVNTNLEAAREIARQLRLRDMAGLVVIDFIDMERSGNIRKVEKAMRDALKSDRARIQVGRISGFGLLEMSRQRLRTGVLEASTRVCPHCDGTGFVRTASSSGLAALRLLEEEAAKGKGSQLVLRTSQEASIYVLNHKRAGIGEIEERYGVTIEVLPTDDIEGAKMTVEVSGPKPTVTVDYAPIIDPVEEEEEEQTVENREEDEDRPKRKRRRRRRGKRGGENRDKRDDQQDEASPADSDAPAENADDEGEVKDEKPKRKRRSRRRKSDDEAVNEGEATEQSEADTAEDSDAEEKPKKRTRRRKSEAAKADDTDDSTSVEAPEADTEEKPKRRKRKTAAEKRAEEAGAENAEPDAIEADDKPKASKPRKARTSAAKSADAEEKPSTAKKPRKAAAKESADEAAPQEAANDRNGDSAESAGDEKPKKGWWQRTFGN